jgi:tetratricopeptide (TPR) repeat protein
MTAALRKLPALLLALSALGACTFWTRDGERIVDQSSRDFTIDPDRHYKNVDLAEIMAHPSSYKLADVHFQAIINRRNESIFLPMYATFRQEDYISFSAWPAEAHLWEASDRVRSLPTMFMRKDNPSLQNLIDSDRFALVDIRARVMGDYEQIAWIEVFYLDEVSPLLYTDQSLVDYKAGMDAVAQNRPAQAIAKLEAAVKSPLAPRVRVYTRLTLGKLYEARGDYEHAAYHYDAVLMDDEKNEAAWDGWERCGKALESKRATEGNQPHKKK